MIVDKVFEKYFDGRMRQVFLYITDLCNLRCNHCLYKTTLGKRELKLNTAISLLDLFYLYGARKLTLIGGEPTLYGSLDRKNSLSDLLVEAKNIGYEYIRLDTNGVFDRELLAKSSFEVINNMAFSLDGHTKEVNDKLRGKGSFDRCTSMIIDSVKSNYYTTITSCIHYGNVEFIDKIIKLATQLGVEEINFHPILKMGIERDNFSGDSHILPERWLETVSYIENNVNQGKYAIHVRLPKRFVTKAEYDQNPTSFQYCPVRMGERILVHPDGTMRICALCIGDRFSIASFNDEEIVFSSNNSEISKERLDRTPCMSQTKKFNKLVPLCISYKPKQIEFVWNSEDFDNKSNILSFFK